MRVLLVKLSSMGDIIHTLPALTDAYLAIPALRVTWIIEEAFQEIPAWHPAVEKVIPIALRRRDFATVKQAIRSCRSEQFDLILDAQGLIKSALITRIARSKIKAGCDWQSCREPVASLFYNRKFAIATQQHAVIRLRQLFAKTFGYTPNLERVSYGIQNFKHEPLPVVIADPRPYIVFLHGTTWASKHWPDQYWLELASIAAAHGFAVQVTWATQHQQARARKLSASCNSVNMLPHLSINQAASVLSKAHAVVAVDTGFAHLAAALDKPLVAIYGATDISKAGTVGNNSINIASHYKCSPCMQRDCKYLDVNTPYPPCYKEITPQLVWEKLSKIS